MMSPPAVAFRVDASPRIGIGHFMRCLTLADGLCAQEARVRFVSRHLPVHLREMLRERGHECVLLDGAGAAEGDLAHAQWLGTSQAADADDTKTALGDRLWDWIVVDHYALDAQWEVALRASAPRILVIDDLADRMHDCDVLLDQNFYADKETRYTGKVSRDCALLLGPRFALLRPEFRKSREEIAPRSGPVRRVLVCYGGVDADNHTDRAIEALRPLEGSLVVDVVIGEDHADRAGIEAACAGSGFVCHVQSNRMAELMAAADLAIGAGGATTWERCCVGLPSLVFGLALNQQQLIRDSAVEGFIYAPDEPDTPLSVPFVRRHIRALIENGPLRHGMSRRAMNVVDGLGVSRVIRHMGAADVELRRAREDDSTNLFEWRNHPSIRAVSHNSDPIDRAQHERWLAAILADPQRTLLIGMLGGAPVGVVRFDINQDVANISIYLVPVAHAPGTGARLLHAAQRWLVSARPDVDRCQAEVLGDNLASHRLFASAGYHVVCTSYSKRLGAP
jgi:UDP-2,4-diacetamido-2,4,6-trideoxy-beta-L-altropyranose hydrolase